MKNRIRKRIYKPQTSFKKDNLFLSNFTIISKLTEILIGAVVGMGLGYGFIFSFFSLPSFLLHTNIFISCGVFISILIFTLLFVLLFKYIFFSIILKVKEVEMIEKILHQITQR